MQLTVFLPVLLLANTGSTNANLSVEVQDILSRNNEINSVEFLGTTQDGKSFFKDSSNLTKTWHESRAFCESFKLTMLTVTSRFQVDFLLKARQERKILGDLWTSARPDRIPIMMKWDNEKGKPDMASFHGFGAASSESEVPYQMCGKLGLILGRFYIRPCTQTVFTVCQIAS